MRSQAAVVGSTLFVPVGESNNRLFAFDISNRVRARRVRRRCRSGCRICGCLILDLTSPGRVRQERPSRLRCRAPCACAVRRFP
jgi:hypothetical protein